MSDLQTEIFTKVLPKMKLNELKFDDDVGATVEIEVEQPTKNVTERIWRFIRDNPGCTSGDIGKSDPDNAGGISTRINQLKMKGFVRGTDEYPMRLYVEKQYTGTSKEDKVARMNAARAAKLGNLKNKPPKVKKKMGRPTKESMQQPVQTKPSRVVDLNNLSIVEARKLYDELKQIFGG
jgi:hypothetical protein